MPSNVEWIKEALRRDPTKTRADIAKALGVDKSAVTRLLSGDRQLKFHEAEKIAAYLGVPRPLGLSDRDREFGRADAPAAGEGPETDAAPIYHAAAEMEGRWIIMRHEEPIDWRPRAPHFERAAHVFGFYAPDDAMAPRFKPGEIVWVDPSRPVKPGDDALFVETARAGRPERVVLGELKAAPPGEFIFIQHKDETEQRLAARAWSALHVLPRY